MFSQLNGRITTKLVIQTINRFVLVDDKFWLITNI